jgi:hypothetical protein
VQIPPSDGKCMGLNIFCWKRYQHANFGALASGMVKFGGGLGVKSAGLPVENMVTMF